MAPLVRPLPLLLLLFTLAISIFHVESLLTKFHFTGKLDCDMESFRYHMVIYEKDHTSGNDVISTLSPTASFQPHYFVATAQDDDDEWDTIGYEVYLTLIHDCNHNPLPRNSRYRKITYSVGMFPIVDGTIYKSFNISVTDAGEPTNDIIGKKFSLDELIETAYWH